MDDLDLLAREFGIRPGGKSAPMRSGPGDRRPAPVRPTQQQRSDRDEMSFSDVFGGPPKYMNSSIKSSKGSLESNDLDIGSIFSSGNDPKSNNNSSSKTSSGPVYDKPVYDDDIFDGLPGLKNKPESSQAIFDENLFVPMTSHPEKNRSSDDLLGYLGRDEVEKPQSSMNSSSRGFDELLAAFDSASPATTNRTSTRSNQQPSKPSRSSTQTTSVMDDPFAVFGTSSSPVSSSGLFSEPLIEVIKPGKPGSERAKSSSTGGNLYGDLDPLIGFGKSMPPFSHDGNRMSKESSPPRGGPRTNDSEMSTSKEKSGESSYKQSEIPTSSFQEPPLFDMPFVEAQKTVSQTASPPSHESANHTEDTSPTSEGPDQLSDDIWLTVSEIPLSTQPTSAPPPSRPPPPIPGWTSKSESVFFTSQARKRVDDYGQYPQIPKSAPSTAKSPPDAQLDELKEFAMGRARHSLDGNENVFLGEEVNANTAAAAMKEAVDNAQAKFRHAKEVRERDYVKATRIKEAVQLEDEHDAHELQEREYRENQERIEFERRQREREEEDREQRRLEREKERARELERERERQAVARATKEARERAAAEALQKAAVEGRMKAERAAVEKASAEARERAEKAAVQKVQAEARERAAVAAREKANAETRERETREKAKADAELRHRAERAAAEDRERAAAEARDRASRMSQQKNDNDLESFFGARSNSVPGTSSPFQDKSSEGAKSPFSSSGVPSNIKKVSSTNNIVDDLSSIFGAVPSSGEFQEVEGESDERRRARLERTQRTQERAAKALAEKNQRDLLVQREQEERHRIAETLDMEIKRWAAGKEGNLRSLLSTLQYVLWPECGWQPVSLTDLITGASVKKVYRKATLCIHPDKVQQKGATLQQKYVSEKVFDLLKEAWNKFNSEELF
ncbi:unnamed protein product [Cuscuta campestris]|uniref:J domain-containing protein n=1 Tax=Cuscuta campestris TaxID=132261 RepID=A0A484MCL5_9ASTE|nr:unnamed protein product [Cuscuta campestris]